MAITVALTSLAQALEIKKVNAPAALLPLDCQVGGRVVEVTDNAGHTMHRFQWPGVYFRAAFSGSSVYLIAGQGRAKYHVRVDDLPGLSWDNPGAGLYVIDGLAAGAHLIRVELATECQGGPVDFGGFALGATAKPGAVPALPRAIEFIGDSHAVGYGNTYPKRECTPEIVWATTDTSQAFGPLVANHYGAGYRINAISGRGIIRNYGGGGGDTLPQAYPFALFDQRHPAQDQGWDPQIIVISLGTNDFSTPLKPEEKWKTREEERGDYERSYVRFVQQLRERHPHAFFLLAANDAAAGEIQAEVHKVIAQLNALGEKRTAFIAFNALELTACDWHPSLADHRRMAAVLIQYIDGHPDIWSSR